MIDKQITCWTLTNGKIAFKRQTRCIAEILGLNYIEKTIDLKKPLRWLPRRLTTHINFLIRNNKLSIAPPWPNLLICSGRKTVSAALAIKKLSHGKTFTIFVQNPRVNPHLFDAIIAPEHDYIKGPNVITTIGALNDISKQKLETAKQQIESEVTQLKKPIISILLGGSNTSYSLTLKHTQQICNQIKKISKAHPGTILLSTSRRTGQQNRELLTKQLAHEKDIKVINEDSDIPYTSILSLSQHILVSNDSVSMISEACATGKPVYLLRLPQYNENKRKNAQFINKLMQLGYVRYFNGQLNTWQYPPLLEVARIAPQLQQMIIQKLETGQSVEKVT
ncbi:MAG: mitochondrial fission ELM1 family protein [Gammaproteobacteria bacterium]|nr:mitochondrial fission ELM1 family protein [Gammaproteobacteria bacterium]